MKSDLHTITSFEELQRAKHALKDKIYFQELELKDTKIFKIGSSLLGLKSSNEPSVNSMSPFNLNGIVNGPIGTLISTVLMANSRTRKYFVSFSIAKEIIPLALKRINEIFHIKK